jgi:hypothetical protein
MNRPRFQSSDQIVISLRVEPKGLRARYCGSHEAYQRAVGSLQPMTSCAVAQTGDVTMTVRTSVRSTPADMATPSDLDKTAIDRIATAINIIVADAFVLYVKTKISTGI